MRRKVLEKAGFEVIAASDPQAAARTCAEHDLKLVMLGHSLLPAEKRRVWAEVRERRQIPILELHQGSAPELMPPAFFHESFDVNDFLRSVMRILQRKD